MHQSPIEQQVLLVVQTTALIALCFRMWRSGLHRKYVYFFTYLLLALVQSAILGALPYGTVTYGYAWLATEAPIVCFYALIAVECYTKIFSSLPGIKSLSRRYIKLSLVVALLCALLLLEFEKTPTKVFAYFLTFESSVVLSVVIFVLLITAYLVYYPVPLTRNVIVYSVGYAVYFLTKAAALFVRNIGSQWNRPVNTLLIAVSTGCLIFWLFGLIRRGETQSLVIGHKWGSGDEERLLSQLQAINASLSRASRK